MADPLPMPQPSGLNDAKGQATQQGYRHLQSLDQAARSSGAAIAAIQGRFEMFGFTYEYPQAKDVVIRNIPFAFEVVSVTTKTSTGSCTVTPKINTTAITGTSGSATTTETERSATAAHTGAAGDDIRITISALSSPEDLDVTVKVTRSQ